MRNTGRPLLLRLASGFGVCGLGLAALGILELLNVLHGGPTTAIVALVAALGFLGISAYYAWAYFWLRRRPEQLEKPDRRQISERTS